MTVAWKRPHS